MKSLLFICLAFAISCSENKIESKPEIKLSSSILEFGEIPLTFETKQFLIIENVGDLPLEVNSISIDSTSIFSVLDYSSLPVTLGSGSKQQFQVNFTPRAAITYEGKLSVFSNTKGGLNRLTLRGKGLAQTFLLGTDIDTLDFGTVVFPNEITKNMKAKNLGNSPVQISNVVFNPEGDFETALIIFPLEIAVGDSTFINFIYQPQIIGQSTAEMTLFSTQANPSHTIFIGNSDAPFAQISSDTEIIEFEDTEIDESRSKAITLKNEGNSELLIAEIFLKGGALEFNLDSVTPMTILPNESKLFNVEFSPSGTFFFSEEIIIKSNSETDSLIAIPINGFGKSEELDSLTQWLTGSFSSANQAQNSNDPFIFDVRMKIVSIWTKRKDGHWVYVEQALSDSLSSPYRQRIYHLISEKGKIIDRIYGFPNPEDFVGSWQTPSDFDVLGEPNLALATGCDVFFVYEESKNGFLGSTKGENCLSSIPEVSYLTSEVSIFVNYLTSWDLGWNSEGDTVLGASSPFIFEKEENFENPLLIGIESNK